VEFYEYEPPFNKYRQFYTRVPVPDVMHYSLRDYGNRVGFWRMLEVLDHYQVPVSVSLNLAVLAHFPEIRDAMMERHWEIFSHGLYNTRFLFGMSKEEERNWVQENIDMLFRYTGKQLKGMFGPAGSLTPNSMELMAECGIVYVVDWFMDDQPFPVVVNTGRLVNVTYAWEINDARVMGGAGFGGTYEADYFSEICKRQFDRLYDEGVENGRVMCIALHPYIIGQPWRIRYLDQLIDYILSHSNVWVTTSDQLAEYYLANYYDLEIGQEGATLR
jgi:peptidoglycan/xylan/chitin deacetylase (PgdA/CDA1 family)